MRILLIVLLMLIPMYAESFDCSTIKDDYEDKMSSFRFKDAMDDLSLCIDQCPKDKDFCSLETISLKSRIRAYVDSQIRIARQYKDSKYGVAKRSYERSIEIAVAYPEKLQPAIDEARIEIPRLQKKIDDTIDPLIKKGYRSLESYEFDRVKDVIYQIFAIDIGNDKALKLAKDTVKKIEEYTEDQNKKAEIIINEIQRDTKKTVRINTKINDAIDKINNSLTYNPGNKKGVDNYERLKKIAEQNGVTIRSLPPEKTYPLTKQFDLAMKDLRDGNFSKAIQTLEFIAKNELANVELIANAYAYIGVARLIQIPEGLVINNHCTACSKEQQQLLASAKNSFINAIRFYSQVKLAQDYKKYSNILESVRRTT